MGTGIFGQPLGGGMRNGVMTPGQLTLGGGVQNGVMTPGANYQQGQMGWLGGYGNQLPMSSGDHMPLVSSPASRPPPRQAMAPGCLHPVFNNLHPNRTRVEGVAHMRLSLGTYRGQCNQLQLIMIRRGDRMRLAGAGMVMRRRCRKVTPYKAVLLERRLLPLRLLRPARAVRVR
jgi:hypothetical protein